jgi:hypothetical protein
MTSRNVAFELVGHSTYHVKRDGEFVGIVQKSMTCERWKCGSPSVDLWFESRERAALVLVSIADAQQVERPDVEIALGQMEAARGRVVQELVDLRDSATRTIQQLEQGDVRQFNNWNKGA